jgi:hypothetical protein
MSSLLMKIWRKVYEVQKKFIKQAVFLGTSSESLVAT